MLFGGSRVHAMTLAHTQFASASATSRVAVHSPVNLCVQVRPALAVRSAACVHDLRPILQPYLPVSNALRSCLQGGGGAGVVSGDRSVHATGLPDARPHFRRLRDNHQLHGRPLTDGESNGNGYRSLCRDGLLAKQAIAAPYTRQGWLVR